MMEEIIKTVEENIEENQEIPEKVVPRIKFASMDPNLIFAGLTREAKMFLWENANFTDAAPDLIEKAGKNAYLLALEGEENNLKYVLAIVNGKAIVVRPAARILEQGTEKLILFLLGFPLKDGREAVMVKQGETKSGLLCINLQVGEEVMFEWTEEEIEQVTTEFKKSQEKAEEPEKPEFPEGPEIIGESETS